MFSPCSCINCICLFIICSYYILRATHFEYIPVYVRVSVCVYFLPSASSDLTPQLAARSPQNVDIDSVQPWRTPPHATSTSNTQHSKHKKKHLQVYIYIYIYIYIHVYLYISIFINRSI